MGRLFSIIWVVSSQVSLKMEAGVLEWEKREAEAREMCFVEGGSDHKLQNRGDPKGRRGQGNASSSGALRRNQPSWHLIFNPVKLILDFWLLELRSIHVVLNPKMWWIVTAQQEINTEGLPN